MKRILIFIFLIAVASFSNAQLVVNTNIMTPAQYVQNVLLGSGITVSNVSFSGQSNQIGTFSATGTAPFLGLGNGLIIATGDANVAQGPNNTGNADLGGGSLFGSSDPDLATIAGFGVSINDAAVLEFDFIPTGDSLVFNFIFGSEEYPEFVNAGFNDAFGFFLSGPGISGPFTNNAANIALVPGTTTPVTIDNVNSSSNPAFYVDNTSNTGTKSIQFDGYTTVLTARSKVICGNTYHIKIAIGDAGDAVYDSGVFLEAGSFTTNSFSLSSSVDINNADSILYEGCGSATLDFSRGDATTADSISFTITGTAQAADYTLSSNTINFALGQDSITVLFTALQDNITEPLESVTVNMIQTVCNVTDTQSITFLIGDLLPPVVIPSDTFKLCNGGPVPIWVDVNTTGYTLNWSNGATTDTTWVNPASTTTYQVTVTDSCGVYQVIDSVTVNTPDAILLNINSNTTSCGQNNGNIIVGASGGVTPYTVQWDDPSSSTNLILTNIIAGTYTLSISDVNGCAMDTAVVITDIPAPVLSLVNSTNIMCNGDCTGIINTAISGGTGTSTVRWTDITNNIPLVQWNDSASVNSLCAGSYVVIISDQAGCTDTLSQIITEPVNALVAVLSNVTDAVCFGQTSGGATVNASFGTSPYTYLWNDVNQQTTNQVTLTGGNYTVTVTDANNCTKNATVLINSPIQIINQINATNISCKSSCDGTIAISTNGGISPYIYNWNPSQSGNITVSSLCSGIYNVSVTDQNGCVVPESITLTEPDSLIASISMTETFCSNNNGSASVFGVTGGTTPYAYNWNDPTNQTTSTATDLLTGNYQIFLSDDHNCTYTLNTLIPDQPAPIIQTMAFNNPNCFTASDGNITPIVISGTKPFTYTWNDSNNQTDTIAKGLPEGTYCVTITDKNGCVATNCQQLIDPSELTLSSVGSGSACYGDNIFIRGIAKGGTPNYSVSWATQPNWIDSLGPFIVSPKISTDYCYLVTDSKQCHKSDCIKITLPNSLVITTAEDKAICIGGSTIVTATGSGGTDSSNYCFSWTSSDVTCSSAISNVEVNPTDTTQFRVILTDQCAKSDTAFLTVNVSPLPIPVFAPIISSGCPPLEADFFANSNLPNSTFNWDFDSDGIVDSSITLTGLNNSQKWTYNESGNYDVTLVLTAEGGCSTSITLRDAIDVLPSPTSDFSANPLVTTIVNSNVSFDASESHSYNNLIWDFGDGSSGVGIAPNHSYTDTGSFKITLTSFNQFGCLDTQIVIIKINPGHSIYAPNAFTPNGDGVNDSFFPKGIGISNVNLGFYVYNRWGKMVFESHNQNDKWDGRSKTSSDFLETGVYIWKLKAFDFSGDEIKDYETTGIVNLVR